MNAGADLDTEIADLNGHFLGATDRTGGSIERGVEAISGRVVLNTVPACEQPSHDSMVLFDEFFPPVVAQSCLPLGGINDVREQHRGQDRAEFDARAFGADESSDPI